MKGPGDSEGVFLDALSKEVDGLVTGFVVLAEFVDADGDERIYCNTMSNQRAHRTMGLLSFGMAVEKRRVADAWAADEEI